MNRRHGITWTTLLGLVCSLQSFATVHGQSPRPLAPGVLKVIPPEPAPSETFTGPLSLPELTVNLADLDWNPNYLAKSETLLELSKRVILRRQVWNLEFAFKPLRMVEIDMPQPNGKLQRKLVWYMVYRVRYFPNDLKPTAKQDPFGNLTFPTTTAAPSNPAPRFFPNFVFSSLDMDKSYLDQVIPAAKRPIEERESPGVPLYNSVEITNVPTPIAQDPNDPGLWGYVTWIDVDPRIDFFSIYVRGLTNAYQYEDGQGAYKAGDPPRTGRTFRSKTLQLNFWRAGDSVFQHEKEIHFGVPIESSAELQSELLKRYGLSERLDYLWVYR